MPFSNQEPTPAVFNLSIKMATNWTVGAGQVIRLSPLNPDGTKFDCTALTGATVGFDNGESGAPYAVSTGGAASISNANATGFTITLTPANVVALFPPLLIKRNTSGRCTVIGTDGVTSLLLGSGIWNASNSA